MRHPRRALQFVLAGLTAAFVCPNALAQVSVDAPLPVSLSWIVGLAVASNYSVQDNRLQWRISERNVRAAWGDFEPDMVVKYGRAELDRQNSAQQSISMFGQPTYSESTQEYGLGLQGKTLTGASYWVGYTLQRKESSLTQDPEFTSFAGATMEQPLLKGGWYDQSLVKLRIARRDLAIAFERYRKQLMTVVSQVESSYWSLAYAQERLGLASDSLEIAERLVSDSRDRLAAGRISEVDMLEAEAGLTSRRAARTDAEQQLQDAMTDVRLLLSGAPQVAGVELKATDPLQPSATGDSKDPSREGLLDWALIAQPDFLGGRWELERQLLVLDYQKNQLLPELTVKGSFGLNGLGNTALDSWNKANTQEFPQWSLSAELHLPMLLGVQARNELAAAELTVDAARGKVKAVRYEIDQSISLLLRRLQSLRQQIATAQEVVDIRGRQLDSQLTLLAAGRSTNREVYQVEDGLSQARLQVLDFVHRYRDTLVQLALVSGSSLKDHELEAFDGQEILLRQDLLGTQY